MINRTSRPSYSTIAAQSNEQTKQMRLINPQKISSTTPPHSRDLGNIKSMLNAPSLAQTKPKPKPNPGASRRPLPFNNPNSTKIGGYKPPLLPGKSTTTKAGGQRTRLEHQDPKNSQMLDKPRPSMEVFKKIAEKNLHKGEHKIPKRSSPQRQRKKLMNRVNVVINKIDNKESLPTQEELKKAINLKIDTSSTSLLKKAHQDTAASIVKVSEAGMKKLRELSEHFNVDLQPLDLRKDIIEVNIKKDISSMNGWKTHAPKSIAHKHNSETYTVKNRALFIDGINKALGGDRNKIILNQRIKVRIENLLEEKNDILQVRNSIPGLHAEVIALNHLLNSLDDITSQFKNKLGGNKEQLAQLNQAVNDILCNDNIRMMTYKLQPLNSNDEITIGSPFPRCDHCKALTTDLPAPKTNNENFLDMRFKISCPTDKMQAKGPSRARP